MNIYNRNFIIAILVILACLGWQSAYGGAWLNDYLDKEKEPEKPIEKPVATLAGVILEASDSDKHFNEALVVLPAGFRAKTVFLADRLLALDGVSNNRELWYGPPITSFKPPINGEVTSMDGTLYIFGFKSIPGPHKAENDTKPGKVIKTPKPKTGTVIAPNENRPGRANGNRQHFFFAKRMNQFPAKFEVHAGNTVFYVKNNGRRYDPGGGFLVKQSDTRPGMAVLTPAWKYDIDTVYVRY